MDVRERRELVLGLLSQRGEVSVAEVSTVAGVSEMTVRRDLDALQREGLVRRVHGGAITAVSRSYEPPFSVRAGRAIDAKRRIGSAVAELIADGETLILDVGTTVLEVARALRGRRNLTVLTASLRILDLLSEERDMTVMAAGGLLRPGELSFVGDLAERAFDELLFDTFVMGVGGIAVEAGLTEFNLDDARVKKHAVASARRCIVAADSSKLGNVAFARIAPLERVDVLVTDADGAPDVLDAFRAADVEVLTV